MYIYMVRAGIVRYRSSLVHFHFMIVCRFTKYLFTLILIYPVGRRLTHAVTGSHVSMPVLSSRAVAADGHVHAYNVLLCFWKSGGMLPLTGGQLLCTLQYILSASLFQFFAKFT